MQTNAIYAASTKALAFAFAALAALSASYWVLKSTQTHSVSIASATPDAAPVLEPGAVARALGVARTAGPQGAGGATESRPNLVLLGVVAKGTRGGAALISIDAKPAKPYLVGSAINDQWVLQSVSARSAVLASRVDALAQTTLELPAPGK
jgi:general secretion pathway protein C